MVDDVSRVSPDIEADFSLTGRRVTQVLERAATRYGLPKAICVDNTAALARHRPGVLGEGVGCLGVPAWSNDLLLPARQAD